MQLWISRLINQVTYEVIRATGELPPHEPDIRHAPVLPYASTYSPWLSDSYFRIAVERVWGYKFVDRLRCYELWSLVRQSAKLGGGALLAVGRRGESGCLIAQTAAFLGIPNRVYLCGEFEDAANPGLNTPDKAGEPRGAGKAMVDALVTRLQLNNVEVLQGIFPGQMADRITEPAFRFAHIDVDGYQPSKDAVESLWPRLVPGGMVVFEDYGTYGREGVTRLLNELALLKDRLFIHNLNGHGVLIKHGAAVPPVT